MSETASTVLRDEHKIILRVIEVLRRLVNRSEHDGQFEAESLRGCVEFFRSFADACHHAKEEDLLFPALEKRGIPREGGPIGVMLEEHTIARGHTRDMGDALDAIQNGDVDARKRFHEAARAYIDLLTQHIFKEDNILFNMADRVIEEDDRAALCAQYCEVACRSFGGRKREELERIANDLDAQWPES